MNRTLTRLIALLTARPFTAAALAGAVAVAGFAPLGVSPLAILALTVLMLLWRHAPDPRRAAFIGFLFGVAFFGAGVSWVYVSLHTFGMMPAPLAALATALFCAFLALFPAAVGYLQARLRAGPTTTLLLAVPALWTLSEWLRSVIFTGFPWLSLGYSQSDTTLTGFAPVLGVFGLSLIAAFCAGLLAMAMDGGRHARMAATAGLVVVLVAGWALQEHAWTTPAGAPIRIALAQGNVPQSMKFEAHRYAATLETYRKLIAQSNARLVVLPETAIPRLLDQVDGRYLEDLQDLMQARGADLLLGAPLRDSSGRYYNSVVSLGISRTQTYSKAHLVPFGEFIPPGFSWILSVLQIPLSDFSAGPANPLPMRLGDSLRVAVNICYEDAFGTEIIRQLPEATLLANVSNVAWFGDSLAPEQHLQISRLRAMETGRYMLRATNTGVTAIIDERGHVTAQLPQFTEGLLQGDAQPFGGATPFVRFGDTLVLLLCLAMGVAAGILRQIRARRDTPLSSH